MIVGVPREIKNNEYRVSLVPAGVRALIENGHKVVVEKSAGEGSGISDEAYFEAEAVIRESPGDIYKEAEIIVKVKEPLPQEADLGYEEALLSDNALRKGLNVFIGKLTNEAVADSLGLEYTPYDVG